MLLPNAVRPITFHHKHIIQTFSLGSYLDLAPNSNRHLFGPMPCIQGLQRRRRSTRPAKRNIALETKQICVSVGLILSVTGGIIQSISAAEYLEVLRIVESNNILNDFEHTSSDVNASYSSLVVYG